jgi:hypothetical protein
VLSDIAVDLFSTLTYRPDAAWEVNLIPFGSVYWKDEMPEIREFVFKIPENDREQLLRMFSIRLKLWDDEPLSDDEQQLWDSIRAQLPNWALFQRLKLNLEDMRAREEAERQVYQEGEASADDPEGTVNNS